VTARHTVWVTGLCWRCEKTGLPVMWLGPVQTHVGTGAFHACERCILRLERLTLADLQARGEFRELPPPSGR
jgi:hypothetical protein